MVHVQGGVQGGCVQGRVYRGVCTGCVHVFTPLLLCFSPLLLCFSFTACLLVFLPHVSLFFYRMSQCFTACSAITACSVIPRAVLYRVHYYYLCFMCFTLFLFYAHRVAPFTLLRGVNGQNRHTGTVKRCGTDAHRYTPFHTVSVKDVL